MKRLTAFVLATILLLVFSFSAFAVTVSGMGEIGEAIFQIDSNNGLLKFADRSSNKIIGGEITSVTVDSSTKVSFSGSFKVNGVSHTFNAVAEDLGTPGAGVDKFSITDSFGYSKSGTISSGEIEIVQ